MIKAFFCDFDGVFTDNHVFIDESGNEYVKCFRGDGIGIEKLKKYNIYFVIISSEVVPIAKMRAKKLGIDCYTSVKNKFELITKIQSELNFKKSECAFLGNDINDLPAFEAVGLKLAVKDSFKELIEASDYILENKGGYGSVREACEYIINKNNLI